MANEGRVALALLARLIIHMTVETLLEKETTRGLLADIQKDFLDHDQPAEAEIVPRLAIEIDENVRDDDPSIG